MDFNKCFTITTTTCEKVLTQIRCRLFGERQYTVECNQVQSGRTPLQTFRMYLTDIAVKSKLSVGQLDNSRMSPVVVIVDDYVDIEHVIVSYSIEVFHNKMQ